MKSFGRRYVTRNTRTAALPSDPGNLIVIVKRILVGAVLIGIFAVSVNLLVKTVVSKAAAVKTAMSVKLGFKMPELAFLSETKYLLEDNGQEYFVSSSGKISPAGTNANDKYMVRLIGVQANEKREDYLKALKQAAAVDKKYLTEASDINLQNLKNIVMITADGGTVYFGDSITTEKMENFQIASDKIKETGKRFKTMNLTYQDMVIIK